MLGTGRRDLSVFGQHDALHQIGVDPTAETAIRAGDDILVAGDRGLGWRAGTQDCECPFPPIADARRSPVAANR